MVNGLLSHFLLNMGCVIGQIEPAPPTLFTDKRSFTDSITFLLFLVLIKKISVGPPLATSEKILKFFKRVVNGHSSFNPKKGAVAMSTGKT